MHGSSRETARARRARIVGLVSAAVALGAAVSACGGHLGSRDGVAGVGGAGALNGAGGEGGGSSETTGSGGEGGRGAFDASAGDSAPFGEPACPSTVAEGRECAPADVQFCYKSCGPEGVGVKSETCRSSGLYNEMVGCSYDLSRDYSCYRIPSAPSDGCGTPTPQAGQPCDVPACLVCNSRQGLVDGEYFSAGGAVTEGWCVCSASGTAGTRTWSCANASMWPCPLGRGC